MIDFTGYVFVTLADQDERGLFDVHQSLAGIVALSREQMAQVKLHRTEVVHSDFQIAFDLFRMPVDVIFRPTDQDRMVTLVFLVAPFDHFLADL